MAATAGATVEDREVSKEDGPIIATLALLLDLVLIYKGLTATGPGIGEAYITLIIGVPSAFILLAVAAFLWGRSR